MEYRQRVKLRQLREIEMKVTELMSKDDRDAMLRPMWFVETCYNNQGDAISQKVTVLDKEEVECVAYVDYGDAIGATDHRGFANFLGMMRAKHKRKEIKSKTLLRPEIYLQLERRLLGNPAIEDVEGTNAEEENTEEQIPQRQEGIQRAEVRQLGGAWPVSATAHIRKGWPDPVNWDAGKV